MSEPGVSTVSDQDLEDALIADPPPAADEPAPEETISPEPEVEELDADEPEIEPEPEEDDEEAVVYTKEQLEEIVEKERQAAKTDTGRKWAQRFKSEIDPLKGEISQFKEEITELLKARQPEPEDYDEPIVMTRRELEDLRKNIISKDVPTALREYQERDAQDKAQYAHGYLGAMDTLGVQYPENERQAILKEMQENFDFRYTNDFNADAEKNFLQAEIALLRKSKSAPVKENPLKGKGKPGGGGIGVGNQAKVIKTPKLDKAAADFVKATGMTTEQVSEALG